VAYRLHDLEFKRRLSFIFYLLEKRIGVIKNDTE